MTSNAPEDPHPTRPAPARVVQLAEETLGGKVTKVTAPGGKYRPVLRLWFEDRTVIASYRETASRLEREAAFLQLLNPTGAPVPRYLGQAEGVLFQSDIGSTRLSSCFVAFPKAQHPGLARGCFESLWTIKRAVAQTGQLDRLPSVGASATFTQRMTRTPERLSGMLGLPVPGLDWALLAAAISARPQGFVKWDSRLANATRGADDAIGWFDWELYGRRAGVEDFAVLIADEFWPLPPEESLDILRQTAPADRALDLDLTRRFAFLQICVRLKEIRKVWDKNGWTDETRARRHDLIGAAPRLMRRLCRHGRALAESDPLLAPAADWIASIADEALWVPTETDGPG